MYQRITIISTYDAWTSYYTKTQINNEVDIFSLKHLNDFLEKMDQPTLKYKLLIRGVKKIKKQYFLEIINDQRCLGFEYRHSFDPKNDIIFNRVHFKYIKNIRDVFGII